MDKFMERAIELATENVRDGGQPFGAVLVKNGHNVAEGVNELHKRFDISAHAEIMAMRRAQKMMHTHILDGYTIYASGEPCPMCLTAMYYAGIDKVYYCASVEDAGEAGLEKSQMVYKELTRPNTERAIKMEQIPLNEGQIDPLKLWVEQGSSD